VRWLVDRFAGNARRVLDIGCGTGYITATLCDALPGAAVLATDVFTEGVRLTSRRLTDRALVCHMDAQAMPFTNCLDLITTFDVIEHIEQDEAVLRGIHGALRPGGISINVVPQHPFMYSPADEIACHVRRYRTGELKAKMAAAGFDIVYDSSFFSLLMPPGLLSRWKSKLTGRYDATEELALPPWLNAAFGVVQDIELAGMKAGLRYPFGISRVTIGRKSS
jgi:SAM-dependent methyltransferase